MDGVRETYPIPEFLRRQPEQAAGPRERPILFSAPMIRAILAGTKSQTRRVVKPQPQPNGGAGLHPVAPYQNPHGQWAWVLAATGMGSGGDLFSCPYGKPGDRLWVRESTEEDCIGSESFARYAADGFTSRLAWWYSRKACPSIHMPRWASRIDLEIESVRVERLQDISEADALAEGVNVHPDHHGKPRDSIYSPVQAYRDLWESINGAGSWAANPWVFVISFRRVKP